MLNTIARPFGMLLLWLYDFLGNYGLALIVFALIVRIILLPFMVKSKKSSLRMTKLQPRINELQKKYAGNQQKLNEEMQKLYRQEGIKPLGGCVWSLIPLPILIILYRAIIYPITTMMNVSADALAEGGALTTRLAEVGFQAAEKTRYLQIEQTKFISEHFSDFEGCVENLRNIDFSFLGINLGDTPAWNFLWTTNWSDPKIWGPGLCLFLLPFINGALTFIQTKVTTKFTEQSGGSQQMQQMKTMNIIMPFITIWFAFIMPSALGLYWVVGIVFSIVQDLIMNRILGKQLEAETAEFMAREHAREAELEAKRAETERLRAENATVVNKNTSKNKQRAMDKQERIEKAAEWDRAHRAKTEGETSVSASQVGDRPFARGRAYMADRFENPAAAAPEEEPEEVSEPELPAPEPETAVTPEEPAPEEAETEEELDEDTPDFYGDDEDGDGDQGDAQ
ncbi:MAG: YidC/Oxa1 family membrane protein insertase [Oscillospiraceae bacterium]|nr:YidC/Oxa1 family membrane protein insertase [Oscillospiraceae bacterium]